MKHPRLYKDTQGNDYIWGWGMRLRDEIEKRLRRQDWEDKIEKKDWKDWKNKIK